MSTTLQERAVQAEQDYLQVSRNFNPATADAAAREALNKAHAAMQEADEAARAEASDRETNERTDQLREMSRNGDGELQKQIIEDRDDTDHALEGIMRGSGDRLRVNPPEIKKRDHYDFKASVVRTGNTLVYTPRYEAPQEYHSLIRSGRATGLHQIHDRFIGGLATRDYSIADGKAGGSSGGTANATQGKSPLNTNFYGDLDRIKQDIGPLVNRSFVTFHDTGDLAPIVLPYQTGFLPITENVAENAVIPKQEMSTDENTLDAYMYATRVALGDKFMKSLYVDDFRNLILEDGMMQIARKQNRAFTVGTGADDEQVRGSRTSTRGLIPRINSYNTLQMFSKDSAQDVTALKVEELARFKRKLNPAYRTGRMGDNAVLMMSSEVASKFETIQLASSSNGFAGSPYFNYFNGVESVVGSALDNFVEFYMGRTPILANNDMTESTAADQNICVMMALSNCHVRQSFIEIEITREGADAYEKHQEQLKIVQYADFTYTPVGVDANQNSRTAYGPAILGKTKS